MPAQSMSSSSNKLLAKALLTFGALSCFAVIPANAQYAQPLMNPNDLANQLNQYQQSPVPPPPGSPGAPPPVTAGDTGSLPTAPTGIADQTAGTSYPVGQGQTDTTVRIFVNENGRGLRQVQTIRPATLSSQSLGQIQGILGQNLNSGEPVVDVTVSTSQMEQLNNVLAPYPNADQNGTRKKINNDSPAQGYPKQTPNYEFQGPLPTVRTFSRYLVLLGVVCATVFMAIASTKVIMGSRDGGACVIGAASGLMMLLSAYTVWKIVSMNTMGANSNDAPVISQQSGQGAATNLPQASVPIIPTIPNTATQRSGIPVIPLSGN